MISNAHVASTRACSQLSLVRQFECRQFRATAEPAVAALRMQDLQRFATFDWRLVAPALVPDTLDIGPTCEYLHIGPARVSLEYSTMLGGFVPE